MAARRPMSEVVLEARPPRPQLYWLDLWRYRELFQVLAWQRDVAIRYKQTAIGVAWAVIRPVLTVLVFTIVFGRIAQAAEQRGPLRAVGVRGDAALDLLRVHRAAPDARTAW